MNKNLTYRRNVGYSSHEQDKDTTGKKKKQRSPQQPLSFNPTYGHLGVTVWSWRQASGEFTFS